MFFLMLLGLAIWVAAHVFRRLAPDARASMGDKAKGPVALLLLLSVALMVIGYRGADFVPVYDPAPAGKYFAHLLMLPAIALMGLGSSKSRLFPTMRHPMLTGLTLWAGVHLLANGDRDSVILFGGLGVWAVVQMWLINRAEGAFVPQRKPGSVAGDIRLAVITLVLYAIIVGIHIWLGKNPFTA